MLTLHHLNNSRSQRILWLLEELQAEYDIIYYKRDKSTNLAPDELKKIHPLGKSISSRTIHKPLWLSVLC